MSHLATRSILSAAIIISLIPHEWMHANDAWFLLLFAPEFVLRSIIACRKESEDGTPDPLEGVGWRAPRGMDVGLLAVDFVALVSFLPLGALGQARWLRVFRLTRTVMLLRYWSPVLRDLWSAARRRERARQLSLMGMTVVVVAFAGVVFLNHATEDIGEDFDGDGNVGDAHDREFFVRMWWAIRQIEDPGNMLSSPHEVATLIVSLFLTVFGLFLVAILIGVGTDVVNELMKLSKLRSSGLRRHMVLINLSTATRQLLFEMMGEYRKLLPEGLRPLTPRWFRELRKNTRQQREFVVVGSGEEPPDFLSEPEFARIVYRQRTGEDDEAFLDRADVPVARRVVLLADIDSPEPDDETIRTLVTTVERLREQDEQEESPGRATLIAEILDYSNIGAALKAITRVTARVDAHVIPTDRLLALFTACVARRPGVASLLLELLTSAGQELYAYDYRDSDRNAVPNMAATPAQVLDALYWRGLSREGGRRVLPVGVLLAPLGSGPQIEARAVLNPIEGMVELKDDEVFSGIVAVAPNLRVTSEFADDVAEHPTALAPPVAAGEFRVPPLVHSKTNPLKRVLILGFRPATITFVEAVVTAEPDAEILVVVDNKAARDQAFDAFAAHSNLVRSGLVPGLRGAFEHKGERLVCGDGGIHRGKIWIETGDWTSSRQLMQLPRDFGSAGEVDAVIMVSSRRTGSDARTTTALMKLEHLQDHAATETRQAVVAELVNTELAQRLARRYQAMGRENVTVFSIHQLRAFFLFQSVVVPSFNLVYSELLAPWGQSIVRLQAEGERSGVCTFAQLAAQLRVAGRMPIAVELSPAELGGQNRTIIGHGDPERGDLIDLSALEAVWVIKPDRADSTARYTAVEAGSLAPPPPLSRTQPP